jgi:hypothetical protein
MNQKRFTSFIILISIVIFSFANFTQTYSRNTFKTNSLSNFLQSGLKSSPYTSDFNLNNFKFSKLVFNFTEPIEEDNFHTINSQYYVKRNHFKTFLRTQVFYHETGLESFLERQNLPPPYYLSFQV